MKLVYLWLAFGLILGGCALIAGLVNGAHPVSALSPGQMTMVQITTYGGEVDIANAALAQVTNPQHHALPNTLVCRNNAGIVSVGLPKVFRAGPFGWSYGRTPVGGTLRCISKLAKGNKLDLTIAVMPQ
jgi:hypothetical protein